MQSRNRKRHDSSGSSGDDNAPITLPLLPLPAVLAPSMNQSHMEALSDASDHSPIVLPLKVPKAAKVRRRRVRRLHRLQPPPQVDEDSNEGRMYRLLEDEQAAHLYDKLLEEEQAAILLHEETARIEEHQDEQVKRQEMSMKATEDENNEGLAQRVHEHERAQTSRQ